MTGADTFVFTAEDDEDVIKDFRSSDGDLIDLTATKLDWSDLDTNGDTMVDAGDAYVSLVGGSMIIDLGEADGGAASENTITFENVVSLTEADFLFG